jgi:hypothetical protein
MKAMIKAITLLITTLVLVGLGTVAALNIQGPTREQLNGDINEIDHQLGVARGLTTKYQEGSALWTQLDLQISTLETTRSMLDQKRRSLFRGISLSYSVNGIILKPASADTITSIQKEIDKAQSEANAAEAKASQYTGGLLQVTALMEAQTNRARAAALKEQLAIAILGLAAVPRGPDVGPQRAPKAGQTVDDKSAL